MPHLQFITQLNLNIKSCRRFNVIRCTHFILTGITEPLEFSFLFVAPILYVIHAFFDGLAFMMADIFNITIGQTFSGGFIDFLLFGVLQGNSKTNYLYVIPIELCGSVCITSFSDS